MADTSGSNLFGFCVLNFNSVLIIASAFDLNHT